MYPPTDDNYGIDSSSIMCLPTTPPIVVIAMSTGKIYHAILLKDDANGSSRQSSRVKGNRLYDIFMIIELTFSLDVVTS